MASINDIITVEVINEGKSPTIAGFGTLLFISDYFPEKFGTNLVKKYTKLNDLIDDGFVGPGKNPFDPTKDYAGDNAYLAAQVYFSQSPTPKVLLIGRRSSTPSFDKDNKPLMINKLDRYKNPVKTKESDPKIVQIQQTIDEDWATNISKISNVIPDFYAVASYSKDEKDILTLSDCIQSQDKVYVISSSDSKIKDIPYDETLKDTDAKNDIFSKIKKKGNSRTSCLYSTHADLFPEAGYIGRGLAVNAGTATFCYKEIKSIETDYLSSNEAQNIFSKNTNTYESIADKPVTRYGYVSNGNYLDIIMGIDYISSRIKTEIYTLLINTPKVPFTDQGILAIQNQINGVLNEAVKLDIVAQYAVIMPKSSEVKSEDKAKRFLEDIQINLIMSGAIQKVDVKLVYKL